MVAGGRRKTERERGREWWGRKMLYPYGMVLHGFSTRLTPAEAACLARVEVLAVNPEARYEAC